MLDGGLGSCGGEAFAAGLPERQERTGRADVTNLEQFVNLSGIDALEASSEPVVAAVEYLLHYAFEQRASDIHIEPRREESIIRMRIDGVLHPIHRIPKTVHGAIANRFKIMSRLDIALKRPQDGRIRTARGETEMELRVSTIPTTFGDKVVIRVLDPNVLVRDLSEGNSRFCELERSLAGISPRTLSLRLRALEEQGIVQRTTYAEVPPRVEYALTDKGLALLPIIESMREYGETWLGAQCATEPAPAAVAAA